jgi:protein SCO1
MPSREITVMNSGPGRHDRVSLYLLLSGSIWFAGGCSPGAGPGSAPISPGKTAAKLAKNQNKGRREIDYRLKGVVKKVDVDKGRLMIAHEAVAGFMEAMTMPFYYQDRALLESLKSGDDVEATLHVVQEDGVVADYELRDLVVTRPAVQHMILDYSKGKVSLREEPQQLEIGQEVPDFSMTTQQGKPLKLSDLRGSIVVLTFIYTRCPLPDFCPLMDRKFGELAQRAGAIPERARQIRLISLSFDPEHDTPAVLAKHAQIRGAMPPLWTFAVATHQELDKVARPLGLFFGPNKNDIAHNLCTAVIDSHGKLARLEVGTTRNKWENVDLLKTIYSLIPPAIRAAKP